MKTTPDWQFASDTSPEPWVKTRRLARAVLIIAIVNVLVIISAPLARLYLDLPGMVAFRIFFHAVQLGLILVLPGLVLAIFGKLRKSAVVSKAGIIILLLGIFPAGSVVTILGPEKLGSPMIHDITTDMTNPPEFVQARIVRTSRDNSLDHGGPQIAIRQQAAYPDIKPIISTMNRDAALDEAVQVVKDLRWEFLNIDYDQGIVEAYDTSRLFGFIDDIVIRVRREGAGTRIDIRSVSRVGKGDLGKNADRIRQFIRTFRN